MVDQLGQRKMNRDKALSSTYTSVLKIHAKVIGISPHGWIGPAEKNVAKKKNGGSNQGQSKRFGGLRRNLQMGLLCYHLNII